MHHTLIYSFLLLINFSIFAVSESCPNYNLYEDSSLLDEMPIKDQGRTGMCYAVTASDMMNFELKKKGSDQEISPFWFALNHKRKAKGIHWSPDSMSFSLLSWSYSDYIKKNHCSPAMAEEKLNALSDIVGVSNYNIIQVYELLWKFKKKNKLFDVYKFLEYANTKFKGRLIIQPDQINTLLSLHSPLKGHKKLIQFYENNLFSNCRELASEKVNLPKKVYKKARSIVNEEKQEKKLVQLLNNKQDSPIAIGYCANILRYPGHRVPNRKPGLSLVASKLCYSHYSLIVGSKSSKNKCEVLIRNSYGEKFWANEAYDCYCQNRENLSQYDCNKDKFDIKKERVLGCWIPSRDLAANTFELNHL